MKSLSIILPMAGNGMRFGGTFKPFLDATEKKFIELAVEPFQIYESEFDVTYVFVYRKDQEEQYHVHQKLDSLFPNLKKRVIILPNETLGPLDTILTAKRLFGISGSVIICDCDHSIPQEKIKLAIMNSVNVSDVVIPTWTYEPTEYSSWSKVILSHDRKPIEFREKENVPLSPTYIVEGMIGCHYVRDIELLDCNGKGNLSEQFPILLKEGKTIACVPVSQASFFGTPTQLAAFRYELAQKQTFFVDIDGTILHLSQHVSYESDPYLELHGSIKQLYMLREQGHHIVLTTGRESSRRSRLEKQLRDLAIPYDQLITGLPSGPRVVINDKKPYCVYMKMAQAIQLRRNEGISSIKISKTPTLIKKLHGGSFAQVFLIQKDDGKKYVRKYIEKRPESEAHVNVLRRQYEDMKRFAFFSPTLIPNVTYMEETTDEYFYDMEYLEGYVDLNSCDDEIIKEVIQRMYELMSKDVYAYRANVHGMKWMDQYVSEKINAKYLTMESFGPLFDHAINEPFVVINGNTYKGLRHYFSTEDLSEHIPTNLSPIHGDLTLNNILYNPLTKDFRIIDPAGSRYMDAPELDMSKLMQDSVARVHVWPNFVKLVECNDLGEFTIPITDDNTESMCHLIASLYGRSVHTARFYLATHLIRMVPYTHVYSQEQALCALLYALSHME